MKIQDCICESCTFSLLVNGDFIVTKRYCHPHLLLPQPFSLLVNGDFIVTSQNLALSTVKLICFQSPSKWRFHCNAGYIDDSDLTDRFSFSLLVNGDFIVTYDERGYVVEDPNFQSPSKWRFHCNLILIPRTGKSIHHFQSPSKWRFHCNV